MKKCFRLHWGHTVALSFCLLASTAVHLHAIPGLQLAVQGTNVLLSWPSIEGQTFVVQYRQTLGPSTPWATLTNGFPAATETNYTQLLHLGIVQYPTNSSSAGTNAGVPALEGMPAQLAAPEQIQEPVYEYFTIVKNGQTQMRRRWVTPPPPLPSLSEAASSQSMRLSRLAPSQDGPTPADPQSDSNNSDPGIRSTGFYRVVQEAVTIVGTTNLTNGVLSGIVPVAFEAANGYDPQRPSRLPLCSPTVRNSPAWPRCRIPRTTPGCFKWTQATWTTARMISRFRSGGSTPMPT